MFDSKQSKIALKYFKKYSIILGLVCSAIITTIFLWNVQIYNLDKLDNTNIYANVSFNKDVLYQRWATLHSGIYVPVTENTQPNPYLAERYFNSFRKTINFINATPCVKIKNWCFQYSYSYNKFKTNMSRKETR